ncbi:flagellar filament capping protein FliD [Paenibacillus sp. FSL P4-0338]|uniref:flagellar filament capping protein FliD n=1 Tax=Paenibacillus sp. FSL P4-0338 TaxID=2921635 RepID=UPI0030F786CC
MVTRVNGFSGMDIDSMVKSMMAAKRVPYDKLVQDKQLLEWKRDSYREINSKLYTFKSAKLTDKYGFNSALNANKAVISGNTDALRAEATAEANGTEMKVSIERLATRATVETRGVGAGKSTKITLAELLNPEVGKLPPNDQESLLNEEFSITINGEGFKDSKGKSLFTGKTSVATVVSTINANAKANVTASFDEVTGKLLISSKTSGSEGQVNIGTAGTNPLLNLFGGEVAPPARLTAIETKSGGQNITTSTKLSELTGGSASSNYSLNIEGETFTFDQNLTISDIVSLINNGDTDSGISAAVKFSAKFDSAQGKLVFTSKVGTGDGKIQFGAAGNTLIERFNGAQQLYTPGVDAQVTINGTELSKSSNSFTINGISLTLLATTAGKTTTINTQTDSSTAIETIKGFIEDYNSMIELLNKKTSEVKYRDFAPLSEEQKKDMKEADIKTWTEKAQSGLLKNDDILRSTVSSMRMLITQNLGDLSSIGITTGQYYENGKLYLNESKLKTAIAENPQKIIDLLQGPTSDAGSGLFDKLVKISETALERFSEKAGTDRFSASVTGTYKAENVIGRTLKGYNSRLDTMQKNLATAENRYYKQFTAMETAMSKLQSQSSSLLSSLGMSSK